MWGQALGHRPFDKLRAGLPTTAKQKPLIKSTLSTSSGAGPSTSSGQGAKYHTGSTVHGPESVIVTPF